MIRAPVAVAAACLAAAACHPSSDELDDRGGSITIPGCSWPAAAETFDAASSTGCRPRDMFQICQVPEGSVVHPDGTITTPEGATVTCHDVCSPSEYELSCYGPPMGPIPSPAPGLGCAPVPVPTPSSALFYCCPCGP